jgi:hypothetical protein
VAYILWRVWFCRLLLRQRGVEEEEEEEEEKSEKEREQAVSFLFLDRLSLCVSIVCCARVG